MAPSSAVRARSRRRRRGGGGASLRRWCLAGVAVGVRRPTTRGSGSRRATSRGRRPAATSSCSTTTRGWRPSTRRPATSASSTPTSPSPATTRSSAASTASRSTTSPTRPTRRCAASFVCPGGQGDVSVFGDLLFMSVEETRGRIDCGTQGAHRHRSNPERFRGVRIFDISDLSNPVQLPGVQTCRGSHTHTHRHRPRRPGEHLHLQLRDGRRAVAAELAGCENASSRPRAR